MWNSAFTCTVSTSCSCVSEVAAGKPWDPALQSSSNSRGSLGMLVSVFRLSLRNRRAPTSLLLRCLNQEAPSLYTGSGTSRKPAAVWLTFHNILWLAMSNHHKWWLHAEYLGSFWCCNLHYYQTGHGQRRHIHHVNNCFLQFISSLFEKDFLIYIDHRVLYGLKNK